MRLALALAIFALSLLVAVVYALQAIVIDQGRRIEAIEQTLKIKPPRPLPPGSFPIPPMPHVPEDCPYFRDPTDRA